MPCQLEDCLSLIFCINLTNNFNSLGVCLMNLLITVQLHRTKCITISAKFLYYAARTFSKVSF